MQRRVTVNELDITVCATKGNGTVASTNNLGMSFFKAQEARDYGNALIDAAEVADPLNAITTNNEVTG